MATGYMIRKGDKTSCGGQVLDGNPRFEIMGQPRASEGDPVSCGVTGQVYQILGGVHTFTNDGRRVAGSLDSSSTCPCKAALVPSCFIFSYESSSTKAAEAQKQHAMGTAPQRANVAAERAPSVPERQTTASSSLASQWEHWSPELIAVAGSQQDQGSGNKMMFIGQAVRELAEFLRSKPALTRTLVVFTPSYSEQMLSAARDSAEGYGANIIEITTAQELIDYLNNGKNRQQSPIERLSLFSHGVPQQIAFGYELPERSRMALDVLNYTLISPLSFSRTAQLDSFACRTGMGNRPDHPIEEAIQFFPQTHESLAQLLANHLRIKVHAFIRRSDYKNTWGSFEERQLGKLCNVSDNTTPDGEWCRDWASMAKERKSTNDMFDFTYQSMGASNPVISGETPVGVPGGYFEFLPK